MKKTLTVNLGGTVFNIDEDAYRLLDNYLNNLKLHFRKHSSAEEIVDDIELRISELFAEKLQTGAQVITITDVEEVIARMGKPEDMDTDTEPSSDENTKTTGHRRFFRNPDDKVLGGVASGIAAYLGWDVVPLRLLLIVAGCFFQWLLLVYLAAGWRREACVLHDGLRADCVSVFLRLPCTDFLCPHPVFFAAVG